MDGEEGIGNEFREYLGIGMMSFAREMACSDGRERFSTPTKSARKLNLTGLVWHIPKQVGERGCGKLDRRIAVGNGLPKNQSSF